MTIKDVDILLEQGYSLKQIAQAYSEIANQKIKRIRANVERNRLFFKEISNIYSLVKSLAIKKNIQIKKNNQTICLLLTSNYRFYGNVNSALIDFYIKQTRNLNFERIVIGKVGIDFFQTTNLFGALNPLVLKNDQPSATELTAMVNVIKQYNQVLVFYSRMKSLLVQEPQVIDITASAKIPENEDKNAIRFIFEPELPKVMDFFDSQILTLLLEETFLESEVARTASRFISMDQAETEANKFIKTQERAKAYLKRNLVNNQLLENFAAIASIRGSI